MRALNTEIFPVKVGYFGTCSKPINLTSGFTIFSRNDLWRQKTAFLNRVLWRVRAISPLPQTKSTSTCCLKCLPLKIFLPRTYGILSRKDLSQQQVGFWWIKWGKNWTWTTSLGKHRMVRALWNSSSQSHGQSRILQCIRDVKSSDLGLCI